jgi:hypothetical protein
MGSTTTVASAAILDKRNTLIAESYIGGESVTEIAARFGLAYSGIRDVLLKKGILKRSSDFPLERFEKKFRVTPGCWLWTGSPGTTGYGAFWLGDKNVAAHRFSYAAYKGEIATGMLVLHSCDNPLCVNPDHLRLGTNSDNTLDKVSRDRCNSSKGVANHFSKLNEHDVRMIRSDQRRRGLIACKFGIAVSTVTKIKNRTLWRHLDG